MSSNEALEYSRKLALSLKERDITAVVYPTLPFVAEGDIRQESEDNMGAIRAYFQTVIPVDLELMLEDGGDLPIPVAFSHLGRSLVSTIESVSNDISANGLQNGLSYESVFQSILRSNLSEAKEENDKKMQAEAAIMQSQFCKYVKDLTERLDKGEYFIVLSKLPKAMDSPYFLSDENARMIGVQLENLLPILDRLVSNPAIYPSNKVRIDGVKDRLNRLLERIGR